MKNEDNIAIVDEYGRFHCKCGKSHKRGPMPGTVDTYRCLGCGNAYRVKFVAALRTARRKGGGGK